MLVKLGGWSPRGEPVRSNFLEHQFSPRNKPSYFPWNPDWLIGILYWLMIIQVLWLDSIIPYIPSTTFFVHCSIASNSNKRTIPTESVLQDVASASQANHNYVYGQTLKSDHWYRVKIILAEIYKITHKKIGFLSLQVYKNPNKHDSTKSLVPSAPKDPKKIRTWVTTHLWKAKVAFTFSRSGCKRCNLAHLVLIPRIHHQSTAFIRFRLPLRTNTKHDQKTWVQWFFCGFL